MCPIFYLGMGNQAIISKSTLLAGRHIVTYGQLVEIVPKIKCQWKYLVSPMEGDFERGSMKVLSIGEFDRHMPNGECMAYEKKPWRRLC